MTNKHRFACLSEIDNFASKDAFVSDLALSSIWGDGDMDEVPQARIDELGRLWDACHRSVPDILAAMGWTQRELSRRFFIPYRTIQNWYSDTQSCPVYILLMMQECLGLL